MLLFSYYTDLTKECNMTSPVFNNIVSLATGRQSASGTVRGNRRAEMLPVCHQQIVNPQPETWREDLAQFCLGLFRSSGLHIPPPVADAVHMSINTDTRLIEAEGNHKVGSFPPYPLELEQFFD